MAIVRTPDQPDPWKTPSLRTFDSSGTQRIVSPETWFGHRLESGDWERSRKLAHYANEVCENHWINSEMAHLQGLLRTGRTEELQRLFPNYEARLENVVRGHLGADPIAEPSTGETLLVYRETPAAYRPSVDPEALRKMIQLFIWDGSFFHVDSATGDIFYNHPVRYQVDAEQRQFLQTDIGLTRQIILDHDFNSAIRPTGERARRLEALYPNLEQPWVPPLAEPAEQAPEGPNLQEISTPAAEPEAVQAPVEATIEATKTRKAKAAAIVV